MLSSRNMLGKSNELLSSTCSLTFNLLEGARRRLTLDEVPPMDAEFDNPVLFEHIEKVTNLTNEPTEVIHPVFEGILAVFNRLSELTQELIDKRLSEKEDSSDKNA